jgi:hypothetical protein
MMHPASVDGQALLYDQPQFMIENFITNMIENFITNMIENFITNMIENFIFMPKKDIFVGTV